MNPFLDDALLQFRKLKQLADQAVAQLPVDRFFHAPAPGSNCVAIILKHIAGNQNSRWRDFLTTDGEKTDRDRDSEFELRDDTRESILARWESGWRLLFDALAPLSDADLARTVTVRGEPHTVLQATNRQMTHYAYHVGQLVYVARQLTGASWTSLSIPLGKSKEWEVAKDGRRYRP